MKPKDMSRPELIREVKQLQRELDRVRQERSDALNVKSKEGLLSSEWIARTGKAERERDEARKTASEAKERAFTILHDGIVRDKGEASLMEHDAKVRDEARKTALREAANEGESLTSGDSRYDAGVAAVVKRLRALAGSKTE
jgi:hypothetical protein